MKAKKKSKDLADEFPSLIARRLFGQWRSSSQQAKSFSNYIRRENSTVKLPRRKPDDFEYACMYKTGKWGKS